MIFSCVLPLKVAKEAIADVVLCKWPGVERNRVVHGDQTVAVVWNGIRIIANLY